MLEAELALPAEEVGRMAQIGYPYNGFRHATHLPAGNPERFIESLANVYVGVAD